MNSKLDHLVNLIFKKLKTYENKKIFLERESLNKFVLSLFKGNWIQDLLKFTAIVKYVFWLVKICIVFLH